MYEYIAKWKKLLVYFLGLLNAADAIQRVLVQNIP